MEQHYLVYDKKKPYQRKRAQTKIIQENDNKKKEELDIF
jgi:hypothetical protein